MLETLLITFREGLEAFLIVAIMLAYLTNTGRKDLAEPVYWGVGAALLLSLTTGWHIAELAQDPVMEGALAIGAGVLVASLTYIMIKNAKNIKSKISSGLEKNAAKTGFKAALGVFIFTVVMIAREGMETAMMLGSLSSAINTGELFTGALLGFLSVGVIGYLWIKQSSKINLRLFMQVTGVFLLLFCVHLFVYGFHELTEASVVPFIDNFYWHTLTEPLEPSEPIGRAITIASLALPCLWLFAGYIREKFFAQPVFTAAE
jgi:high-affinity iron transporter